MKVIQLMIEIEDEYDSDVLLDNAQTVAYEAFGGNLLAMNVDVGPGPDEFVWRRGS